MATHSITEASAALYKLLEPFSGEERLRIVNATLMLLGDASLPLGKIADSGSNPTMTGEASEYFKIKNPQKKGEEPGLLPSLSEMNFSQGGLRLTIRNDGKL